METSIEPSVSQVGIYVEIPGLHMGDLSSLPLLGMLTESLRGALQMDSLILPSKPSPEFSELAAFASAFFSQASVLSQALELIRKFELLVPARKKSTCREGEGFAQSEVLTAFLKESRRLTTLAVAGSQEDAFAQENCLFVSFHVRDTAQAIRIVRNELQRLNILAFSEVGHFDRYPAAPQVGQSSFENRLALVRQRQLENLKDIRDQMRQAVERLKNLRGRNAK